MAQAAGLLAAEPDLYFVCCSNGTRKEALAQMSARLTNVLFLLLRPPDRLNDLLLIGDICLLPRYAGVADLVMPSKRSGKLASGQAFDATASKETRLGK